MALVSRPSAITLLWYCALALFATMTTGVLHAQESAKLRSGARVRVTIPGASPATHVATLLAVRGDSLLLQTEQPLAQFVVANAPPPLLEVSLNAGVSRGGGLAGGVAGFLVGVLVAKTITTRAHSARQCPDGICSSGTYLTALGSVVVGTIVGVAVGRGNTRERWDAVALPATVVAAP